MSLPLRRNGLALWRGHGFFPPRLTRAQHIQAYSRDDCPQPSRKILDAAPARTAEPQLGLLHGVLRLAERAEHSIGHRSQGTAVLLELLR